MDELILSLRKFNFSKNKKDFQSDLDYVIKQFDKQELEDDYEWDILKENYSKIIYLNNLVKEYINNLTIKKINNDIQDKFNYALDKFMENIDNINIRYIHSIDWEKSKKEFNNIDQIEKLLNKSINISNSIDKLHTCLEAYNFFIPIVEKLRGQQYDYSEIQDRDFIEDFNYKKKKI